MNVFAMLLVAALITTVYLVYTAETAGATYKTYQIDTTENRECDIAARFDTGFATPGAGRFEIDVDVNCTYDSQSENLRQISITRELIAPEADCVPSDWDNTFDDVQSMIACWPGAVGAIALRNVGNMTGSNTTYQNGRCLEAVECHYLRHEQGAVTAQAYVLTFRVGLSSHDTEAIATAYGDWDRCGATWCEAKVRTET